MGVLVSARTALNMPLVSDNLWNLLWQDILASAVIRYIPDCVSFSVVIQAMRLGGISIAVEKSLALGPFLIDSDTHVLYMVDVVEALLSLDA